MAHYTRHRDIYTDANPILTKSGKCIFFTNSVCCVLDKIEIITAEEVTAVPGLLDAFSAKPPRTYRLCLHMISGTLVYGKECSQEEARKQKIEVCNWITGYSATTETPVGPETKPETEPETETPQ